MAKRGKRGLTRFAQYLLAPLFTLALIPLYLQVEDEWMHAALALILSIGGLSGLGTLIECCCICGDNFSLLLLAMQMTLVAGALVSYHFLSDSQEKASALVASSKPEASHLIYGSAPVLPVSAEVQTTEPKTQAENWTTAPPFLPAQLPGWKFVGTGYCEDGVRHEEFNSLHASGRTIQECSEVGLSSEDSVAFDFADRGGFCDIRYPARVHLQRHPGYSWWGWGAGLSHPAGSGKQKQQMVTNCYAKLVQRKKPPVSAIEGLPGWTGAGKGYCEEAGSRSEFSSLHASGKSLQECAKFASQHEEAIAFDFAPSDGGCDIRFPAGAYTRIDSGYTWWGFGGGRSDPVGSGKNKHDLDTDCYAKISEEVAESVDESLPSTTPRPSAVELEALLSRGKGRFSIVLACASEGSYMVRTVQSFCDKTPSDVLQEIIVVDDGSDPPLERLLKGIEPRCRVKTLRHDKIRGLMIAKQTGGDASTGEFIGFFDCHVSPLKGWHQELMDILRNGHRRLAVPIITDLDLDTWEEKPGSQSNSKCYIDFHAEFMWFEDSSDYIPTISGGLVAISRSWWQESGGFDGRMRGWGGENIDQSLRTWLCGGEILRAKSSRIAHMWRVPSDSRTVARYHVGDTKGNLVRVVTAWFDKYLVKVAGGSQSHREAPNVSNILQLKESLGCKPFTYFLHRFRRIYVNGGLLPSKVFKIKSLGKGLCVQRRGASFALAACEQGSWFHLANQDPGKGGKCCSGIREWNAMECFDRLDHTGLLPYFCDVPAKNGNQIYEWGDDGLIKHPYTKNCLSEAAHGTALAGVSCATASRWEQVEAFKPPETSIYEAEVARLSLDSNGPDN